jgi:colanic acid/amylovoran biosynthesis protein
MPDFKNILITVGWTSFNKGDAAILLGLIKTIKESYPLAQISILSSTPNEDYKYYSKYAKTYERLFNTFNKKKSKITFITLFFKLFCFYLWSKKISVPLSRSDKTILNLIYNTDLVIAGGGGYLGGNKTFNAIAFLFPLYIAKNLGKKTYVCAHSIEPFNNWLTKIITVFFLNRVDLITVREPNSFQTLKSTNVIKPFHLTADTAFLIDSESLDVGYSLLSSASVIRNNKLRIGITVTNWKFPNDKNSEKALHYITSIVNALEQIIETTDAIIIFFPNSIYPPKDDDRIISLKIKQKIKQSLTDNIYVLTEDYAPEYMQSMIGTMDLFIGTRMHSNIFAASMKIPLVAISYEKKHYGIMNMLGLDDYVIDILNIDSNKLVELIKRALENSDIIRALLEKKIPIIKKDASRNIQMIKSLIN